MAEAAASFADFEDPRIAKSFDYTRSNLTRVPKEYGTLIAALKKHLNRPLDSLSLKSGQDGHLAVYSPSMDSIQFNLTRVKHIKKMKLKASPGEKDFGALLASNEESLEKWQLWQGNNPAPKDQKKARGAINRLHMTIRNLKGKIEKGEASLPGNAFQYAKNLNQALELIVVHEIGHRDARNMDVFKRYHGQRQFVSDYSQVSPVEYQAEIYSLVKTGLLNKTGLSAEAKKELKKAA